MCYLLLIVINSYSIYAIFFFTSVLMRPLPQSAIFTGSNDAKYLQFELVD